MTKTFKIGDTKSILYGTTVKADFGKYVIMGKIVGKATTDITQMHIIKCNDGQIPNNDYPYDTFTAPLAVITVF